MMSVCHFISLNVRGLRNKEKRSQIFRWFKCQKADVIFIQETYWTSDIENLIKNEWRGSCYFSHGSNHSSGVAILFDQKLNLEIIDVKQNNDGKMLLLKVHINDIHYTIVNVYAPTQKKYRERFFRKLQLNLLRNGVNNIDCNLILGGDWNCVLNPKNDVQGTSSKYYKKPRNFGKLLKRYALCDIWRKTNPLSKQFTWRNHSLHIASRLDYWLVNKNIQVKVITSDIRPVIRADHNAISLKIGVKDNKIGPGYWKMNTSILNDEDYQHSIRNMIDNVQEKELNSFAKWELLKIRIREFTQKFCKRKTVKKKTRKELLQEKLETLEKLINEKKKNIEIERNYRAVKEELENIYKFESKGAGIRARVKWMEEGERSTKYFLRLEKRNASRKGITQLTSINGKRVLKTENDILKETVKFYSALYTNENLNCELMKNYVHSQSVPCLNRDDRSSCEGLLTIAECKHVLFSMQKNKTPGSDGIPVEFYQVFWSDLNDILVEALNECYANETMSNTQRKGLITLLYKKGDRLNLKNWRPITLLNCDYKIIAAVLARRVQKVIRQIINPNQTGYVKGRLAAYNVRLTKDIIEYMLKQNLSGAIMMVDFTKAFDVIDMSFVYNCLDKLNFGPSFQKWVKILYTNITSSVFINGWISEMFQIKRGIRQGCPLSALLFILAAEFMANRVRENDTNSEI